MIAFKTIFLILLTTHLAYGSSEVSFQENGSLNLSKDITSFGEFSLEDEWEVNKYKATVKGSLKARYFLGPGNVMIALPELYLSKVRGQTRQDIGRVKLDWLSQENFWGLGVINGHLGFNFLDSDSEGSVGFQLTKNFKKSSLKFFGSIVHIPSIYPGHVFNDGEISAGNEWSKLPPSELKFLEGTAPVNYELITPDFTKLLLRPSVGFRYQRNFGNADLSLFGMIKPENKLRIGAYGHYDQLNGESAKMRVRAYSINQTVYGGELNIPILYTNLKLSAVWTTPDEKYTDDFTPESYENYQFETDLNSERHLMASIYFPFDDGEFELNYISSSRKLLSKARRRSEGSEDVFSDELRFVNGIGLLFRRDFTDNFSFFTKWMVDAGRADQLIKSEASYNLQQKYQFTLGAQFLNVPDDESFWSSYRSNDMIYGRLSFKF